MDEQSRKKLIIELRERINEMSSAVQLLSRSISERGGERETELLAVMEQDLYRLLRTVTHLELTGPEKPTVRARTVDAAGLCRDLGREVESALEMTGVGFQWDLRDESVLTQADDGLLELALLNLITNAVEHAGPRGHVSLRGDRRRGRMVYTVKDDGSGLERPGIQRDPYLKVPGGIGLGLAAARRCAEAHGGSVVLEDHGEGGGVSAVMSIPLRAEPANEGLRSPELRADRLGGFSHVLVELSPVLPAQAYLPRELD